MSIAPGKPTMFQWKATYLRIFKYHKLVLLGFSQKRHKIGWVGRGWFWENLGEGVKYDQNTLYNVLKELIKIKPKYRKIKLTKKLTRTLYPLIT